MSYAQNMQKYMDSCGGIVAEIKRIAINPHDIWDRRVTDTLFYFKTDTIPELVILPFNLSNFYTWASLIIKKWVCETHETRGHCKLSFYAANQDPANRKTLAHVVLNCDKLEYENLDGMLYQ